MLFIGQAIIVGRQNENPTATPFIGLRISEAIQREYLFKTGKTINCLTSKKERESEKAHGGNLTEVILLCMNSRVFSHLSCLTSIINYTAELPA